jgi:hypothetical protein
MNLTATALRFLPNAKSETRLKLRKQRVFCDIKRHHQTLMSMHRNAVDNRDLLKQASAALVYLGIFSTFAAVSLIVCVIWLLIW